MAASVFFPGGPEGNAALASTSGSCAVFSRSDSAIRRSPGKIVPPAKAPCSSNGSTVTADPASTTIAGRPGLTRPLAASTLRSRSIPTAAGSSTRTVSGTLRAESIAVTVSQRAAAHSVNCLSRPGLVDTTAQTHPGAKLHYAARRSQAVGSSVASPRTGSLRLSPSTRQNLMRLLPISTTASGIGGPSGGRLGREGRRSFDFTRKLVQLRHDAGHQFRQPLPGHRGNRFHFESQLGGKTIADFVAAGELGFAHRHKLRFR